MSDYTSVVFGFRKVKSDGMWPITVTVKKLNNVFSQTVCFGLHIDKTCVPAVFSESPLNTDTRRIIRTVWHVPSVSVLTGFHCTHKQVSSLVGSEALCCGGGPSGIFTSHHTSSTTPKSNISNFPKFLIPPRPPRP